MSRSRLLVMLGVEQAIDQLELVETAMVQVEREPILELFRDCKRLLLEASSQGARQPRTDARCNH